MKKNRRMDGNLLPVTCIATSILTVVLGFVTTVSNGFLLYVLYKDPLKRFTKPVTTFITALAIMDFLTGVLCDPSQARFKIRCALKMKTEAEFELRGFTAIVSFFTINSTTLLIVAISAERFVAVSFPYFYRQSVTRKRTNLCVIAVCIHSFVFSLLQLAEVDLGLWKRTDLYLHIVIPILLVMVSYTAICLILRIHRNKLQTVSDKIQGTDWKLIIQKRRRNEIHKQKREQKIVYTAVLVTLLLILAFLPHTIVTIAAENCKDCVSNDWFVVLSRVMIPFVFMNSAVNPFVYVLRMRDLRRSMKMTLGWLMESKTPAVERRERNAEEDNNLAVIVTNQFNCRNTGEGNNSSVIVAN